MKIKKFSSIVVSILLVGTISMGSQVYGAVLEPPPEPPPSEPEPEPEPEPEEETTTTPKKTTTTANTTTTYASAVEESASAADTKAPKITDIKVSGITTDGATITWKTNEKCSPVVEYGTSAKYGKTEKGKGKAAKHSLALKGLSEGTKYYFRVKCVDGAKNSVLSKGQIFETKKAILPGESGSAVSFSWKRLLLWLGLAAAALLFLFFLWKRKRDNDGKKKKVVKKSSKRPVISKKSTPRKR